MNVHPVAAAGFSAAADAYERARPTYAREAVEWVAARGGVGPGVTVVDLAAGTGKLTRALVETGARVIAIEPLPAMLAKLRAALPDVEALEGTAEAMPLADGAAGAVTVGQAFHWFEWEPALREIHRVLQPDGLLALLWNTRDLENPLQRAIDDELAAYRGDLIPARGFAWEDAVAASPLFGPAEHRVFDNPHTLTRAGLRDRVASTSFVAALNDDEREALLARVLALAEGLEEPFSFPYVTDVFLIPRSRDRVA